MTTLTTVDEDRREVLAALEAAGRVDDAFLERLDAQLPALHLAAADLDELTALVAAACTSWNTRPVDLRVHDAQRAGTDWLNSERMLGGTCDAGRYAGNLAGIRDEIGYFRELGLTCLHLRGVLADARTVDPSVGRLSTLTELAADLRLAGIALCLDLPVAAGMTTLAEDALFLANRGVDMLHVDAAADQIAVLEAVLALGAPAVAVAGATGRLVDDALLPALLWDALATHDPRRVQRTLERRHPLPEGAARLVTVRDHEDLGWEDAGDLGIDESHRRRIADFYLGRTPGSVARGIGSPGPDGPRIAGTTASLAGIEAGDPAGEDRVVLAHAIALSSGGVPMLYLGDEVAQLNDPTYADDPARRDDPRWVHRGNRPRDRYAERRDAGTPAGRVFARLTTLIAVRQSTPEFSGAELIGFHVPAPTVLGYQRPGADDVVLVLANVGATQVLIDPLTLSGFERNARDLVHGVGVDLDDGLALPPYGFVWLRVLPLRTM